VLFVQPGEEHKRLRTVERLAEQLAEAYADRSSLLVAFGGGVIGDIGGFLAAIFMRGIDYVQVPTTLLSQVDSSVGGKTGVNLQSGKNLVGSFYHPLAVFADIELLQTLTGRELRAGLFESIKAGIIRDRKLFTFMERHADEVLARDPKAIEYVVAASVAMKAEVVGLDERENGLRMVLNYGHTLGHAIEAATRYKRLLHGEAVAWGMIAATRLAQTRATITQAEAERIEKLIGRYGPLPALRLPVQRLLDAATRDKKNRAGVRRFVLPKGIGNAEIVEDVTDQELYSTAESMLATARQVAEE
jgi:3-dehydroquinate synthase